MYMPSDHTTRDKKLILRNLILFSRGADFSLSRQARIYDQAHATLLRAMCFIVNFMCFIVKNGGSPCASS
jgi:hypothetical protein